MTLDNANYSGLVTDNSGNSTLALNFTGDEISGSNISSSTVTYASGSNAIKDESSATNEVVSQASLSYVDGGVPVITAASWQDADANGKIDQIELTFSEPVDDSQGADLASNSVTLGSSYVVSSINTGATGDDAQLRVVVTEAGSGVYDTELIPTVTLVQSKIGDGSNNQATTNQGAFTPSDGAAPVIVSTSFTDNNLSLIHI